MVRIACEKRRSRDERDTAFDGALGELARIGVRCSESRPYEHAALRGGEFNGMAQYFAQVAA